MFSVNYQKRDSSWIQGTTSKNFFFIILILEKKISQVNKNSKENKPYPFFQPVDCDFELDFLVQCQFHVTWWERFRRAVFSSSHIPNKTPRYSVMLLGEQATPQLMMWNEVRWKYTCEK